tara:strand:+ start:2226 stop:2465 length:240 start_codon:yes stop_codon:yes gene_type:complete
MPTLQSYWELSLFIQKEKQMYNLKTHSYSRWQHSSWGNPMWKITKCGKLSSLQPTIQMSCYDGDVDCVNCLKLIKKEKK